MQLASAPATSGNSGLAMGVSVGAAPMEASHSAFLVISSAQACIRSSVTRYSAFRLPWYSRAPSTEREQKMISPETRVLPPSQPSGAASITRTSPRFSVAAVMAAAAPAPP